MTSKKYNEQGPESLITAAFQRVLSRTIPGAVSPQNKGAIDWGCQGFLAYGAQTTVVVVDPVTLQCAQTLSKHRSHVNQVKWKKTLHYHQVNTPYSLTLASADNSGTIIVWDVAKGEPSTTLQDSSKNIFDLQWLGGRDGSEHLLVALYPPYSVVVWDTRHSSKIWKKSYTESLVSFDSDPFHSHRMAFLCSGCILFVDDFSMSKCPSSNGKRYYITSPRTSPGKSSSIPGGTGPADDKDKSSTLKRKMKNLVAGESKPKGDDASQLSECMQLLYHRTLANHLLLVYPREILILDLDICQTIGLIAMDRGASPVSQVISCSQRDALYVLSDSGSVCAYLRRKSSFLEKQEHRDASWSLDAGSSNEQCSELVYDRKCMSEALRLGKNNKAVGLVINPITEKDLALVIGDGRVVFKELVPSTCPNAWKLHAAGSSLPETDAIFRQKNISGKEEVFGLNIHDNHFSSDGLRSNRVRTLHSRLPRMTLADLVPYQCAAHDFSKELDQRLNLHILMTGLMPSVAPPNLVLRMCPPLTTRNIHTYTPLLAAGTQFGSVQVFNIATGMMEREFSLHTYPVRGIEWTSLNGILSFGHQPLTNGQGRVRNELIHTDIKTGYALTLRTNKAEESPIEMLRVSYLKQYFVIILEDDPVELWDCQKLIPLRTMSPKFPKVVALEWSPTTHSRRKESLTPKGNEDQKEGGQEESSSTPAEDPSSVYAAMGSSAMSLSSSVSSLLDKALVIKESFVFTDPEGHVNLISVEGNVVKDARRMYSDYQLGRVTGISWKSNEVVFGDSDGTLVLHNMHKNLSKPITTHRGAVRKIRFAPGRDNMKLMALFGDGVDIWDVREVILISQLKTPKDCMKIVDADWGASDRVVLVTADGCIRIMDMSLKQSNSPMSLYCAKDPVVSPCLFSGEVSLNLRTLLTHQPWRCKYSLDFTTADGFTVPQLNAINTWLSHLPSEVKDFLITCNSTPHRALVVARLFGDMGEIHFWNVATYYLSHSSAFRSHEVAGDGGLESSELISLEDAKQGNDSHCAEIHPTACSEMYSPCSSGCWHTLESSYSFLCDNFSFRRYELECLTIQENKGLSGSLRDILGRKLSVIGERDRVVRLLLDMDSSNEDFYTDCLRACMLSDTHHSSQAQSTIKLVATNLIAAGKIWEGIELLCIIGKAGDACRYLQSYGHWHDSIWLAKCVLSSGEGTDIIKRWAYHLISSGNKDCGVSVLLSIGCFTAALEQLVQQHYHQRAALLYEAALQYKRISVLPGEGSHAELSKASAAVSQTTVLPSGLSENVHKKYILHLFGLGNRSAVLHYCQQLGEKGEALLKELDAV